MLPAESARHAAVGTVEDKLPSRFEHSMRLAQEADQIIRLNVLDHLAREDKPDLSVLDGLERSDRSRNPLDLGRELVRLGGQRLEADVTPHRSETLLEPLEVP